MADAESVTAAVMIIGDEILSGRTQDTNLRDIARYLAAYGVDLAEARVVPDHEDEIIGALNHLRARYDYVITTGGIGPTHDDITADCVAAAFGVALYEHPDIVAMMAARWGGELNAARRRMARVPHGGSLVKNPVQGPPGFQIENVFTFAGIPSVAQGMFQSMKHRLVGGDPVLARTVRTNLPEGIIAEPLGALQNRYADIDIGSYPAFRNGRPSVSLVLRGTDDARLQSAAAELIHTLKEMNGEAEEFST